MPTTTSLANDLRITVQRLARRVRFEGTPEVAPHLFSVLVKLRQRPHTPGELAQYERVSAPSMTRTVNCLVDAGYVDRIPDPDDGRQRLLTLTAAGESLVERTVANRDDWMSRRLSGLSDADRAVLARSVEILRGVLAE